MKTVRLFLLALLVTIGILSSAAPIIAATGTPPHPSSAVHQDSNPTPTPTPLHTDGDECSGGGC